MNDLKANVLSTVHNDDGAELDHEPGAFTVFVDGWCLFVGNGSWTPTDAALHAVKTRAEHDQDANRLLGDIDPGQRESFAERAAEHFLGSCEQNKPLRGRSVHDPIPVNEAFWMNATLKELVGVAMSLMQTPASGETRAMGQSSEMMKAIGARSTQGRTLPDPWLP
jgi:hypothetical protein